MSYQVSVRQKPRSSSSSLYGAPGELRISTSRLSSLRGSMDAALPGLRAGMDSLLSANNHQEAMQGLNERLAGYVERVKRLEAANRSLEEEIQEITASRSTPTERNWEPYESPLVDLRKQVEGLNMDNAKLLLHIDNARLAADDIKVKLETEQAMCDGVQKDTQGLRKMIDDTNHLRMKLESELESLKEELAHLRQTHKEEVEALMELISKNNVTVVDAPKKPDLNAAIAEIRVQYEKLADENKAKAQDIYKDKFNSMSQDVNKNTQALEQAKGEVNELRRQLQGLQVDRQTLQKTVDSLEQSLRDTEGQYGHDMSQLNQILHRLQDELAACRADIARQVREYEALLDLKTKLENEINNYRQLLEGAIDREESKAVVHTAPTRQTIRKKVVTVQEIVNGQVVSTRSEEFIN
ncbi:keratin, type I cytoskeletal 18-B-like isoform X1 [Pleurodeles waltl]|uniref:keratin, type I cytoskeletal 18-B-like isoform X1 n=1 Tax=Pleurodeles waltl TaxID=8319 RepID=UPI0037098C48